MTVCTHLCRGNFRSSWVAEGGYDHVAEALFGDSRRRLLPRVRRRALGRLRAAALRARGKMVVLGLVTTKRGELESKDELKRRIDEAARYVAARAALPVAQCGFSSTVEGNALTIDEQKAKLALIVEAAREVWG